MPGFRITNIKSDMTLSDYKYAKLYKELINYDGWHICRATLDKFIGDKPFYEDELHIVVLEGVTLNSAELIVLFGEKTWKDTVHRMIEKEGPEWFSRLEGPVSGAVYYKTERKWIIFTSYLGEKAVYYWSDKTRIIAASQLKYITDLMKELEIKRDINEEALCRLAAYNSYIGNETCIKSVKRLYPGEYLVYKDGELTIGSLGLADVKQDTGSDIKSEKEYIDRLDDAFLSALNRILDKNREYGYATLVDLSGGYDSRMNIYTANKLRKDADNIITFSYDQSGCHDEKTAKSIASELGMKYIFMSLDDGSCLYDADSNVCMLNGATRYCSITGGRDSLRMISGMDYGLEITGLLGDVHDGSMVTDYPDGTINPNNYMESTILLEGEDFSFPIEENNRFVYHKNEHFWFYNRGMICGMGSFFIRQNFGEPVTPFGDRTFIREYLSIPWNMRVNGRLLRKWLAQRYPAAAEYTNERTSLKLKNEVRIYSGLLVKIAKQISKAKRTIKKSDSQAICDPEQWYMNNEKIRQYIDDMMEEELSVIAQYEKLGRVMNKLKRSDSMFEKEAYITINAIIKNFVM